MSLLLGSLYWGVSANKKVLHTFDDLGMSFACSLFIFFEIFVKVLLFIFLSYLSIINSFDVSGEFCKYLAIIPKFPIPKNKTPRPGPGNGNHWLGFLG